MSSEIPSDVLKLQDYCATMCMDRCGHWYPDVLVKDTLVMNVLVTDILVTTW